MHEHPGRLDSWKEIAEYLGRDVRTAMRWAKSQGLPVRRVAGGRGRSVFAFEDEVDEWMSGQSAAESTLPPTQPATEATVSAAPPRLSRSPSRFAIIGASTGLIVLSVGAGVAFRNSGSDSDSPVHVSASSDSVRVRDRAGVERVLHRFDPAVQTVFTRTTAQITDIDSDTRAEITVGVSYYEEHGRRSIRPGELLHFDPDGTLRWRFAFDEKITFREATFGGPWGLTDWQVGPASSPSRIAVAAHDNVWWASIASVIDHNGQRVGSFVNPGWIESLSWLDRQRLAIAGFNNARDAAMVALIDPARSLGQAPGSDGTPFECLSCPADPPLFYATLPRSELNRLTGSRFNRAQVSRLDIDRIVVMTIEVPGDPLAATAVYEFDESMQLRRARYDDVYWDAHRRLELEGRLSHGRADCPERDGPPTIHVWSQAGWERIAPPR